jgi:hypothetical protein
VTAAAEPEFTLGIEEEYFLANRATCDVVDDPPPAILVECDALHGGQVGPDGSAAGARPASGKRSSRTRSSMPA